MPGAVPTNRHKPIPIDSGPISACFDDDPKLLNCEIAQPSLLKLPIWPDHRYRASLSPYKICQVLPVERMFVSLGFILFMLFKTNWEKR